jgi:hypothetical protein
MRSSVPASGCESLEDIRNVAAMACAIRRGGRMPIEAIQVGLAFSFLRLQACPCPGMPGKLFCIIPSSKKHLQFAIDEMDRNAKL